MYANRELGFSKRHSNFPVSIVWLCLFWPILNQVSFGSCIYNGRLSWKYYVSVYGYYFSGRTLSYWVTETFTHLLHHLNSPNVPVSLIYKTSVTFDHIFYFLFLDYLISNSASWSLHTQCHAYTKVMINNKKNNQGHFFGLGWLQYCYIDIQAW